MQNGDETVLISKFGGDLEVTVHSQHEDVSVVVPLEAVEELISHYDGEAFDASDVVRALVGLLTITGTAWPYSSPNRNGWTIMDLNKIYCLKDRVASRKIVDEVILVPLRDSVAEMENLYSLNEVAARVYELVDGRRAVRDICSVIVEEFDVSPEQAEADVSQFVEQLESIHAIEVCPEA